MSSPNAVEHEHQGVVSSQPHSRKVSIVTDPTDSRYDNLGYEPSIRRKASQVIIPDAFGKAFGLQSAMTFGAQRYPESDYSAAQMCRSQLMRLSAK